VPDNNNASKAANHWLLDAGKVHDSAEVFVNGNRVGCVWTTPFQLDISRHLRKGANTLRLDVVNKAQNRIIDMHRRGVDWQKCNLEVNDETGSGRLKIDTLSPLVSGLLGPVSLRCSE
jgi:hypothetical protein